MDTSLLIARFLGSMMLVAGVAMFVNRQMLTRIYEDISNSPGLIFIAGAMALAVGVAFVTFHNIWVADWRVFITVYGWLALLGGIVRMVFPDVAIRIGKRMMANNSMLLVTAGLNVIIGAFLCYQGFVA